jgi:hypothetical protein
VKVAVRAKLLAELARRKREAAAKEAAALEEIQEKEKMDVDKDNETATSMDEN